jgi:two-component system, OmpR family, response regulator
VPVLLIEDSDGVIALVRRTLETEGYEVDVATGGEEGLELVRDGRYLAVIIEARLPGLSGLEVCRRLRERDRSTRVLVLSAADAQDDRLRSYDHGADDHLAKPFSPAVLRSRLRALLPDPLDAPPTPGGRSSFSSSSHLRRARWS